MKHWISNAGMFLLIASVGALLPAFAGAQAAPVEVSQAQRHDVSPPLSSIPAEPEPGAPVFREIPRQPLPKRGPKPHLIDPVRQSAPIGAAMPAASVNFDGVNNVNGVLPPDTNGAVGPNHYVQWVNLSFAVWNKTGLLLYGPVAGKTLWSGFGGPCEAQNDGDPIVLYDHLADRWFMSQFALPNYPSGPFYQCIAVSTSGNPMGTYNRYQFLVSATKLNDYPKFGVWPDGYYMAVNQFTCSALGCSWAGQGVAVFDRANMLAGQSATMLYLDRAADPSLGGMLPATLDGPAPPAGTPNYFVQFDDDSFGYSPDQLQIWQASVNWATPSLVFTPNVILPTAGFDSNMCGYATNCIPQNVRPARKLDALSDRLMYRLQYRQFGTRASMVVNHTVDVDGTDHAGIRWYELRNTGGGWAIYQESTYAPDASHRWMGSIAMDSAGNIALGYSASSATSVPSIRYTGRLVDDPLNLLPQGETTLIAGGGGQTHSSGRWGDYSAMTVDPVDGCTFWYTQQYYAFTSNASWRTRVGAFKFPSCTPAAPPASADLQMVSKAGTPGTVAAGSDVSYELVAQNNGPDPASGVVVTDTLPGSMTFKSAGSSPACSGASTVTCTVGALGAGVSTTLTVVATVASNAPSGAVTNTASVSGSTADPNSANNSANTVTTITGSSAGAPTVSGCNPSSGIRNQQLTVTVSGSGFQNGATANFGDRVTVQSVTFTSATTLSVRIKVNPQAPSGPRPVTITNPDGQSGALSGCFTVN